MLGAVVSGIQRGVGGGRRRVSRGGAGQVAGKGARVGGAPHGAARGGQGRAVGRRRGGARGVVRLAGVATGQDGGMSRQLGVVHTERGRLDNICPDSHRPMRHALAVCRGRGSPRG